MNIRRFTGFGVSDAQRAQDLADAALQGSKDAAAAVAKSWPKGLLRKIFDDEKRLLKDEADRRSHKTADSLMSSIREMVHAEITGDGEQYSRHETVVRNELNELYSRLGRLEYFIRQRIKP